MKDKQILVYGTDHYRLMGMKGLCKTTPSEITNAIHLPDVYELMSMVEDAMDPQKLPEPENCRKEIVQTHRLRILDRRSIRNIGASWVESGYCWAPVFVGDAGSNGWDYSDFMDRDERLFKFLPDKNKAYREAALWNRRRVQTILCGDCTKLPSIMHDTIHKDDYWCLFGELIILSICSDIPKMWVLFESASDVPKYVESYRKGSSGPFAYVDSNILCPGEALKRFSYADLLKPVYIHFDPNDVVDEKRFDLYHRTMENWKSNVATYGLELYWRN